MFYDGEAEFGQRLVLQGRLGELVRVAAETLVEADFGLWVDGCKRPAPI